jgi:hypothetical protein
LLKPMIDGVRENFKQIGEKDVFTKVKVTADSGFHSEANIQFLDDEGIDAYVADNQFRKRDPRFANAQKHKVSIDRRHLSIRGKHYFTPSDFTYNELDGTLLCPAGNNLYVKTKNYIGVRGQRGIAYQGWKTKCRVCKIRRKCLRSEASEFRQVVKFEEPTHGSRGSFTREMIKKFDSAFGQLIYSKRMGAVEPVFANICSTLGLNRITLRGRRKADIQWKLYSMVHNIFKIYRYGASYAH